MSCSASPLTGIRADELCEALPESLANKLVHLHWIERSRAGREGFLLSAKIEVDGQILLLHCPCNEQILIDDWDVLDPAYHTNARLLALERILTTPQNEELLLRL
jgi:hypothetical protein